MSAGPAILRTFTFGERHDADHGFGQAGRFIGCAAVRVSDHLDVIATKYFDHAMEAQVTFSRARSFFTCDINVHAGRGLRLRGEGEAADANSAFDDAAEHIAKRLRRYRRRVNEHARDSANRERPQAARQYILQQEDTGTPDDGQWRWRTTAYAT